MITLWYDNVDDYIFFRFKKCSFIEDLFGLSLFLII